eukprot:1144139-Pelagomonas_calceolata.AAC.3
MLAAGSRCVRLGGGRLEVGAKLPVEGTWLCWASSALCCSSSLLRFWAPRRTAVAPLGTRRGAAGAGAGAEAADGA